MEAAPGKGRGQDKSKQESGHVHSLDEPGAPGNRKNGYPLRCPTLREHRLRNRAIVLRT